MKLLPVTLTLFDKATNNTYKGTLLLKNLDALDEDLTNGTMLLEREEADDYDGQGAGLFIILVMSIYAFSIVLFIASFITKKPNTKDVTDENTVNIYLHKVGDLKEKTARDHFKKLKMSITSKIEMDSEIQKRERVNSKNAKDIKFITSSKNNKCDSGVLLLTNIRPTEAIPSTGLLPKEDDATQPLLSAGNLDLPSPSVHFDKEAGDSAEQNSSSLRRETSARMLMPNAEASGEMSRQVGRTMSSHDVSHGSSDQDGPSFPKSQSEPQRIVTGVDQLNREDGGSRSSLFKPVPRRSSSEHGDFGKEMSRREKETRQEPSQLERPRPRYPTRSVDHDDEVWQHMPQKPLPPPPTQRTGPKSSHLRLQIPTRSGQSDIWVRRNGRNDIRERSPEGWAQPLDMREQREVQTLPHTKYVAGDAPEYHRDRSPRESKSPIDKSPRDRSPRDKSQRDRSPREKSPRDRPKEVHSSKESSRGDRSLRDRSLRDKSPRDRSPRDRSPRDWSPRDRSPHEARDLADVFLFPQDSRSLPLPFRSPSPRSPSRSPKEPYLPMQARISQRPSPRSSAGQQARVRDHKPTLRVTLDRSPDPLDADDPDGGGSTNRAFEQSPRLNSTLRRYTDVSAVHGDMGRTPAQEMSPQVGFSEATRLQVPGPHFPVSFSPPETPRRTVRKSSNLHTSKM